ncbi:MAG: acyltransferase family protein [Bdellovibrionales bacterium]|nr:acyltransferase family protein [Bdellovibrionales bacterium]
MSRETVRVEGLEGMRGIAAFVVFVHHFLLIFHPPFYFGPHDWRHLLLNPNLAVSWFFAHSGFVLAWKSRDMGPSEFPKHILDLLLRRYLRLLPLVLVSILLTLLLLSLQGIHSGVYAGITDSKWLRGYLRFQGNLPDAIGQALYGVYFQFKSSTSYNPSLWTIGYELISSYLLFFAIAILRNGTKSLIGFALIALACGTWKGILPFFLGAALTRLPLHTPPRWLLPLLTLPAFALSDLSGKSADYVRGICAAVLMYVLLNSPRVRAYLAQGVPDFLGKISYALYAIHFLILVSFTSWLGCIWSSHETNSGIAINFLMTTALLISVSYFLYRWVDHPGIQFSKWFAKKALGDKPFGESRSP